MKKTILSSSTTQSVAAAGTVSGAAITLADILQQTFPESSILANPAITAALTFLLNSVFLPWLSRQIAAWRGK